MSRYVLILPCLVVALRGTSQVTEYVYLLGTKRNWTPSLHDMLYLFGRVVRFRDRVCFNRNWLEK